MNTHNELSRGGVTIRLEFGGGVLERSIHVESSGGLRLCVEEFGGVNRIT